MLLNSVINVYNIVREQRKTDSEGLYINIFIN